MPVSPPIALTCNGATVGQVGLTWTDRNNPGFAGLDHYRIESSPDLVTFTFLGNVSAAGTLAFTDTTVTPGTFSWYRVTAQDASNTQLYAPGTSDVWTNVTPPSFWIEALESLTGPFGVGISWGYVDPSQAHPVGSLLYPPALIAGATVEVCCVVTTGGVSTFVLALNNAALTQSAFTSLAFVDQSSTTETYLTSAATFSTSGGLAIWTWPTTDATPFANGTNYLMTVSGGGAVSVPNIVGDVLATGQAALVTAGLVSGTVTTAASGVVPPGDIISTTPVAGTSVSSGSSVAILESTGIAVPNVVNETLAQAEIDILAAGLTLGAVTTGTSITILYGNIISQSPAAGTGVAAGAAIAMVESIGLPTETIPNVVGDVLATGEAALVAAGLVTGVVTTSTSITIAAGSIISQSLLGFAVYGTAIDLVESTGLPTVPVPNVVGMPLATANATLVAAGFVPGTVTTATSITIPGGSIISQSVTGTALYGTTVNMVESSGLPTVTVPNVVTDTVAVATAALVAANLVLGVVSTGYSATIPNGEIMSQDVTGTALYGTPVDLVMSLGPPLIYPPVIGQNVTDATATLAGLGLTLGQVIQGVSEDFPIGIIYAYSPPGGVPPASTVDLFVSALYLSPNGAKYAALITSEHNQKPKYMALVNFLCSVMADITQACAAIPAAFDLDLAVGNQLDIIGLWVGQPRVIQSILITGFFGFADDVEALPFGELTDPSKGGRWYELNEASTGTATLGDTAYRTLLKARIIRNQSDGTTPEIEASLLDIFGAPCAIADAGTLSLAITVPVPITPEEEALVGPLDLLPRPAGVRIGSITYTP